MRCKIRPKERKDGNDVDLSTGVADEIARKRLPGHVSSRYVVHWE